MRLAEKIACLFWLALSVGVAAGSYKLGLGTPQEPESGFLPFWTAILLCILTIAHFRQLIVPHRKSDIPEMLKVGEHWKRLVGLITTLTIYAIVLSTLGYLLSTFFLMTILFSLYGRRKWWVVTGASVLVVAVTYIIFNFWLTIQLPKGLLGI